MSEEAQVQEEYKVEDALLAINECLVAVHKRLEALETYVQELPTPEKTYYKPEGYPEYLNLPSNFKEIYSRIKELEDGMQD